MKISLNPSHHPHRDVLQTEPERYGCGGGTGWELGERRLKTRVRKKEREITAILTRRDKGGHQPGRRENRGQLGKREGCPSIRKQGSRPSEVFYPIAS